MSDHHERQNRRQSLSAKDHRLAVPFSQLGELVFQEMPDRYDDDGHVTSHESSAYFETTLFNSETVTFLF